MTATEHTEARDALAEEMNAHAKTQAELERRTAWSNEQLAKLAADLAFARSQCDDNENAWGCEKQKREAAEAEVARLRDTSAELHSALDSERDHSVSLAASLATELSAHEATKAERDGWVDRCDRLKREAKAAEARVAELERELQTERNCHERVSRFVDDLQTAIDQARGLLVDIALPSGHSRRQAIDDWLRAHPAAELERLLVLSRLNEGVALDALDQARGFLERFFAVNDSQQIDPEGIEHIDAALEVLRAHPAATAAAPESIQAMVRRDLVERERLGVERYGTALYPNNGRKALQDAYEEILDLAQYLKQELVEQARKEQGT